MGSILATCGVILGALAIVGYVTAVADSAPNINNIEARTPGRLSEIFASDGTPLGYVPSTSLRIPLPSSQIPSVLKQATVAIEDRRFYQHGALDYQGIVRAAVRDIFGGGSLQGASTLTMQLIDNLYLKGWAHNLHYKIVQAKMAQELYKKHSRNWILTEYLNDVPYGTVGGQTAYGAGAASEVFFDKPVGQLTLAQAALLAGLPQAPSEYNPFLYPSLARGRRDNVLQAMVRSHYISQSQASAAEAQPLGVRHTNMFDTKLQPYVFDYVVQQLNQRFCPNQSPTKTCPLVERGGLKVYSTINLHDEQIAQQSLDAHEGGVGNPAAALASIDPSNGHILAIANTSQYSQTSFDYATQALRQPGSAFKVFALMTLIHDYNGDPNQTYYNSHFLAAGWLPSNPTWSVHTDNYAQYGDINLTRATIISDNTVYAQLVVDLGVPKFEAMAHAMGITSPLTGNPAEVIGGLTYGVTPLEMADAYATIANGGYHIPPTAISTVVFPDGRVVNLGNPPHTQVFSYGEAYAATSVLKQVITNPAGTGTAADYGCPAAGKTGTAENLDNAWFVGYTPILSTAVWVGYPQGNIPMANGFGGALAAPIWHDYMAAVSNGYCGDWTAPSVPWQGVAFVGAHAVSGPPKPSATGNGTGGVPVNPYNNPQLFAAPPQGPPPTGNPGGHPGTTSPSGGTGPPPGFGNGHSPGAGHGGGRRH